MTFAEDKTYKYIRDNHSKFCCVDVLEILPYLSCLTASDQDRLRASYRQLGNQDTLWELFNKLQRRLGWVEVFIRALRICELPGLAEQVTRVYQSYLPPGTSLRSLDPLQSPAIPATVSGPSAFAPGHNSLDSGFLETPSYPRPVQDTQPPESPVENSEQLPQANFRAVPRMSGGSLIPSPNLQALSPQPSREHHEQGPALGGTHAANADSVPIATYGPVSPTVSFQPLPRTALRTNLLSGATVSVLSADTSLSSSSTGSAFAKAAGDQAKAATRLSATHTDSATASSVPSVRLPGNTMSSKLPISSKSSAAMTSTVLTDGAPSKLPINSVYAGTVPSKVPASVAKAPDNTIPPERNSKQAKETLEAPATIVTTGGKLAGPDSSSRSLRSGLEMSKPGVLMSQGDNEPFSACSVELAISPSSSLSSEPNHGPEENEYSSFRIQVDEGPSADLLGSPEAQGTQQPEEQEELCAGSVAWAKWLGATSALVAAFLAVMLYRSRRLTQ
ncbi:mitochondrial antiviral-signaling protein [Apodemus sylvaticus]|uniref:mitochondrial antiviral-signaling protein n=1 Tax=Apodemus sylvaticus TaxID=10129 RepID=UPI002243904A|nr:mitochondrial antiviral-signaling protein [Apodemus sylvaticus]XP_052039629.1 mitochondrial antiviral-signaling protein [Apodemus sylvaticus]